MNKSTSTGQSFTQRILPFVEAGEGRKEDVQRDCLHLLARHLARCIRAEFQSDRYVLLDWPAFSNIGDHAIYLGEKYLLAKHLGAECIYAAHHKNLDVERLKKLPSDAPILFNGGGNLGDLWSHHQKFREAVLQLIPNRRVIILPQTMFFQDPNAAQETARLFQAHPHLTIYLRDITSFHSAAALFGASRVRLAPDMAFALIDIMPEIIEAMHISPVEEILYLYRTDKEHTGTRPIASTSGWVQDWPRFQKGQMHTELFPHSLDLARAAGVGDIFQTRYDRTSWDRFLLGVEMVLKARHVITDRLHGHIIALLCSTPHTLVPNLYFKNSSFYFTWTAGMSDANLDDENHAP